jgi:hypothetical protein
MDERHRLHPICSVSGYIKPHGQRGVIEVTTVDQADMRALASHKTENLIR